MTKNVKVYTLDNFESHGFKKYGSSYVNPVLGITLNQTKYDLDVFIDDFDCEEEIETLKKTQTDIFPALVALVKSKKTKSEEPGFVDDMETNKLDFQYLRSIVKTDLTENRRLIIFTWGKRLKKSKPQKSQNNFNASVLNGRAKGIDLKNNNGKNEDIQRVVSRCSSFEGWINFFVAKVEKDDLSAVSINCAKGRHRSVAAAEIIKKVYYPNSQVIHLTIR